MRSFVYFVLCCASISALSGCQCFRCTDRVMDHLDDLTDINDNHRGLDHVYCEKIDVTRWCMNGPCMNWPCVGNNSR